MTLINFIFDRIIIFLLRTLLRMYDYIVTDGRILFWFTIQNKHAVTLHCHMSHESFDLSYMLQDFFFPMPSKPCNHSIEFIATCLCFYRRKRVIQFMMLKDGLQRTIHKRKLYSMEVNSLLKHTVRQIETTQYSVHFLLFFLNSVLSTDKNLTFGRPKKNFVSESKFFLKFNFFSQKNVLEKKKFQTEIILKLEILKINFFLNSFFL